MDEHLQAFILSEVECGCLIDSLCLAVLQVVNRKVQCLFVVLHELWLRRVSDTAYARRQYVVHWSFLRVFLNVHGTCFQGSARCCHLCSKLLVKCSPFTPDEVETAEAQYYWSLEVGEEHSHEPDACEVAYGTNLVTVSRVERNAELIPLHLLLLAVA